MAFGLFGSSSAPHIVHTALIFEVTRVFLCHRVPHKSSSFMMSSKEYVALSKKSAAERDDDTTVFRLLLTSRSLRRGDDNKTRAELAPPFSLRDWSSNISQE